MGTAAVLSFVFNGLGQLYNGQIAKGLIIIFFSSVSLLILVLGSVCIGMWLLGKLTAVYILITGIALFSVGLIAICGIGIYSILDAHKTALRK
jgi:arabinogalactan oligomer / maltooligosaccharide transport system permease protein